jgi:hypothetical protein
MRRAAGSRDGISRHEVGDHRFPTLPACSRHTSGNEANAVPFGALAKRPRFCAMCSQC